jgi:protein-S-isoprenylcysteine O-methyltransferase Ste14
VIIRNVIPTVLSVSLVGLVITLLIARIKDHGIWDGGLANLDVLFVFVYLCWIISEFKVSKEEIGKGNKTSDYGTCELYATGQAAVFLSALWLTPIQESPHLVQIIGFVIFVLGITLRLFAIKTLGKYYSHIVRRVENHKIIDSGPYRYIRHPAYAGMILANLGIVLFYFNWVTLLLFALVLLPAIILRILIEEKTLFKIASYPSYAQDRSRLIPGIW